jgi:predicted DNA-binding transcriptional regulator AlpA
MLDLLTECDVAQRLHVSLASLRRWRLERRGPRFIKVSSLVRYRPEDIEEWLAALPTGGTEVKQASASSLEPERYRKSARA